MLAADAAPTADVVVLSDASSDEDAPLTVRRKLPRAVINDDDDEPHAPAPLSPVAPARAQSKPAAHAASAGAAKKKPNAAAGVEHPTPARKGGGKWTADQDQELADLVIAHGDGTKQSWSVNCCLCRSAADDTSYM